METIHNNSELFSSLATIIIGAIFRAIEKRKLKKAGLLKDSAE
jgi:hypothetical protein